MNTYPIDGTAPCQPHISSFCLDIRTCAQHGSCAHPHLVIQGAGNDVAPQPVPADGRLSLVQYLTWTKPAHRSHEISLPGSSRTNAPSPLCPIKKPASASAVATRGSSSKRSSCTEYVLCWRKLWRRHHCLCFRGQPCRRRGDDVHLKSRAWVRWAGRGMHSSQYE